MALFGLFGRKKKEEKAQESEAARPALEPTPVPAAEPLAETAAEPAAEVQEPEAVEPAAEPVQEAAQEPVTAEEPAAELPEESAEAEEEEEEGEEQEDPAPLESGADPVSLEPASVFGFFRDIAAIPRGSGNTQQISDYLASFARERNLDCVQDQLGNIIITKPASEGAVGAPVILQGHMDMVCEKNPGVARDMTREGVELVVDGQWLRANGTTLGGDDGIAVAMMLALLDDDSLTHPALECLFTVDEETGMYGAEGVDLSGLQGRRMLNLDSEDEGLFTAGCAGGADVLCTFAGSRKQKNGTQVTLEISGLQGGHSGSDIGRGRANANLLMGRLLDRLYKKCGISLISIEGGTKNNAIPRQAQAKVLLPETVAVKKLGKAVKAFAREVENEYAIADPDIEVECTVQEDQGPFIVFGKKFTRSIIGYLLCAPSGVLLFDRTFHGVPQTSLNLGVVRTMADGVSAQFLLRSSINSQKKALVRQIECLTEQFGGQSEVRGEFPAWEFQTTSAFRDLLVEVYRQQTGKEARIEMIHGGVECGLLASKLPGLDAVSIGPDMENVHTPAERLSIPSVQRTWTYLLACMERCARE